MTYRPKQTTIVPPPDRERKTDPPLPTEPAPPPDLLNLSENVLPRLAGIELGLAEVNLRLGKLDELHALLMGASPEQSDGKSRPSIVSELHAMNARAGIIGTNTEIVAEVVGQVAAQQKTLPELIAEAVANRVVALYQAEIRSLRETDEAMLARIDRLTEVAGIGSNGNGHQE